MSVIRYTSKLFNNVTSRAYIYFEAKGEKDRDGELVEDRVKTYVREDMSKEEYVGFVQKLASDLLQRHMISIEDLLGLSKNEIFKLLEA